MTLKQMDEILKQWKPVGSARERMEQIKARAAYLARVQRKRAPKRRRRM